ncbi:hypothetical protein AB2B38_005350 [Balneola sp. MJW-20]|uniref:hypothetical protein n=1 Tax=Gracilimonas aurantiaca TaxID=3234185 RepID=UPI00390C1599
MIIIPSFLLFQACSDFNSPTDVSEEITGKSIDNARAKQGVPDGVVYNEFNRNYYQAVNTAGLTWDEANEAAESMPQIKGCKPHLATITSSNEQAWIESTFPQAITGGYWLGGKQADGAADPAADWGWVTGETWLYTNWNTSSFEPNDFNGEEEESLQFLPAAYDGGGTGGWNDAQFDGLGYYDINGDFISGVDGYLVEWDCKVIVTGGGNIGGHVGLNAQKSMDTSVKGQASVVINSVLGDVNVHLNVSCLAVWDNRSWIGGTITKSGDEEIFESGLEYWLSLVDNGQGAAAENDQNGFIFLYAADSGGSNRCALQLDGGNAGVLFDFEKGNIQVH